MSKIATKRNYIVEISILTYFIFSFFSQFRYIKNPAGNDVDKQFLQTGNYEVEVMGQRYPAETYIHSPFDPQDRRLQGIYD